MGFVRRAAPGLTCAVVGLVAMVLALAPGIAVADSTGPDQQTSGTLTRAATPGDDAPTVAITPAIGAVQNCVNAGRVWLVVVTDVGAALANRCIDRPANAAAALTSAGLSVERDASGTICRIGGFPSTECLGATANRVWQEYTATTTTSWQYVQLNADEAVPQAGTLVGWCFGSQCTPPDVYTLTRGVNILSRFTAPVSAEQAGGHMPATPWLVAVGVVIVVAVIGLAVRATHHRARGANEA